MSSILEALERTARGVRAGRVLIVGVVALLALRLVLSLARSGPVIMADEGGYLLHGRVLAGGMPAEMGSSPFYRGGYSLLLAPVLSVADDPLVAYHLVLAVNALLAASLVPLLYLLITRCFGMPAPVAAWAAIAGGAYPTVTALSQVALAENVLFPLTVAWLLGAGALLRASAGGPAIGPAAATSFCAGLLWTAHGRMLVVVCLTAGLLLAVALVRRRRAAAATAAGGLLALAATMAAGQLLNDWLLMRNHDGARLQESERVLSVVDDLDGVAAALANVAGQGWYLLVATLGLALVLLVECVPPAAARLLRRRPQPGDALLALVVLATGGLLVVSALWFATRDRPDQLVYGRYTEPMAPILVALGIGALADGAGRQRLRLLAAGLAALTVLVAALRSGLQLPVQPSRWNVASLPSPTGQLGPPIIAAAGVVAVVALSVLLAVARRAAAAVGGVVLVLLAPTTAYVAYLPVLRSERDVYPAGWTSPRAIVEQRGAQRVGYDLDRFDHIAVKVYQWFMPRTPLVTFHGEREAPPGALYFSGRSRPAALAARPARPVWRDPGRDQVLWQAGDR